MRIVVVIGSATPPGRTQSMADVVVERLRATTAAPHVDVIDLARIPFQAADGRPASAYDATVREAVALVGAAHGVVVASPVYRGTYAGVFKNFLDIVPLEALRDTPVALAVVGGSLHHYLGVDAALRSVLAWYGALALPTSVYLTGNDFDEAKRPSATARERLDALADALVTVVAALDARPLGPAPLGAP